MSLLNWSEILKAFLVMFAVIDIIGGIPMIINIKKQAGSINSLRASLVSLGIMVAFLYIGEKLIGYIGIDVYSFAVAGSFVLLFLALEMILGVRIFKSGDIDPKTASVVPIAFPIIAGAGSMTTIISLRAEFEAINILIAIVLNIIVVFAVLRLTNTIERVLGKVGIAILNKVFGIILLAIAVKLFGNNVQHLFH